MQGVAETKKLLGFCFGKVLIHSESFHQILRNECLADVQFAVKYVNIG